MNSSYINKLFYYVFMTSNMVEYPYMYNKIELNISNKIHYVG